MASNRISSPAPHEQVAGVPPQSVPVPRIDPSEYRVQWIAAIGSRYRLWWYDDGLLCGTVTQGWVEVGEYDAHDTIPEVAAVEHGNGHAYEEGGAYEHNGDKALMESLGLKTTGFKRDFTDLGTVVLYEATEETYGNPEETKTKPATTIKVEVAVPVLDAQSWRFTVTRPRDEVEEMDEDALGLKLWRPIYEPVEVFEVTTGSGGFGGYWESVMKIANHCFEVERIGMRADA